MVPLFLKAISCVYNIWKRLIIRVLRKNSSSVKDALPYLVLIAKFGSYELKLIILLIPFTLVK